jgi:hypothetical protein
MLAPGEFLINPHPEQPPAQPPAERAGELPRPTVATAQAEGDEPRSFLLILLRALGAVHT